MTYELILGDYAYSSWSLRAWLLFEKFGIDCSTRSVTFADERSVADQMPDMAPAKTVPAMRTTEGAIVGDSLALAEELAQRHAEARMWPDDPLHRATARHLAAEMHSGFLALRAACPMNVRQAYHWANPTDDVLADIARIDHIWNHARTVCAPTGPWLCGEYSIADAFYAPVAARIAGFSLDVSEASRTYVDAHLNDPAFRRWRAMGLVHGATLARYKQTHDVVDWPGPKTLSAKPTTRTDSANSTCPYSGGNLTDFLELEDGRVFGFCNPFCRDKTAADPMAWPEFVALAFPDAD